MIPTSILVISVLIIMMIATCTVAFVHGWQDGPDNRQDRHQWLPAGFYALGWRLRRARYDVARRELEASRAERDRFNAILDHAWKDEAR